MVAKITPRLIDLTYEAALKAFWRKNALRKFLRGTHISESFLATWAPDESKREFLDRLFAQLQKSEKGKAVVFRMARSLAEITTFPDLRNWEDSEEKVQAAARAVGELKQYLRKQDEEIRSEREREDIRRRARDERARIQRAKTDIAALQTRLDKLSSEIGTQQAGYDFEAWFFDYMDYCEIQNRRPYKVSGRQIDGSITFDGTTYLVELKFTSGQSGATDIDSIKAKVQSKADNTMAIVVSMAGFSNTAISEASGARTVLLLFDAQHIYMCLSGILNFSDVLSRVRRHASQTGESFLPAAKFSG